MARTSDAPAALRPAEVARRLSLSPTTVHRRIHDGTIPSLRIGSCVLVPEAAIVALLASATPATR